MQETPGIDTGRCESDFPTLLPKGQCDWSVLGSAFSVPVEIVLGDSVCASLLGRPPMTTATLTSRSFSQLLRGKTLVYQIRFLLAEASVQETLENTRRYEVDFPILPPKSSV